MRENRKCYDILHVEELSPWNVDYSTFWFDSYIELKSSNENCLFLEEKNNAQIFFPIYILFKLYILIF